MKRSLLLLLHICTYAATGWGQTDKLAGWGVEANIMADRMLKHTPKIRVVPEQAFAYELNFIRQTSGAKEWEQRRNYPVFGFGITLTDYGVDSVYGKCISLYPNLQIPLVRGKHLEWTIRAGFGLGYITKRFERLPDWDTLNTAIGSRFNNYTVFATDLRYRINEHLDVQLGGNFSHVSNAAFRTPNLGINLYGAHLGLRYFPVTSRPERIKTSLQPLKNRWLVQARLGISGNEMGPGNGPLYPVYLATAYVSKRYLGKNKAIAGIDYSYHNSLYAYQRNNEINPGNERANAWKGSVYLGHEFLFGRMGVWLQMGVYINNPYPQEYNTYQKLGGNVYIVQREQGFLKELYACALLKTHKTEAELVEMGLGFGF